MTIIYAGTITMDPEVRGRFLEIRQGQMERYRREPGVLGYSISADELDPGVVNVFECYVDDAALEAHQAIHERNLEIPVLRYDLYRYDGERRPLIVT